jgi:hypothetical protein
MSKKSKHVWTDEDDIEFGKAFGEWVKKADKKYDTVDWEKLAKQLQEALAKEMKESERLDEQLADAQIEVIQASGIIKYLEKRIADCMDMMDGNEPI